MSETKPALMLNQETSPYNKIQSDSGWNYDYVDTLHDKKLSKEEQVN
jgi:hypothetical protein